MQEMVSTWPVGSPAMRVLVLVPTYNEIENIADVLHRARTALPDADVLVIDTAMSTMGGLEVARSIRTYRPRVKFVFITASTNAAHVAEALEIDASAYLSRRCSIAELEAAIAAVVGGERYVTTPVAAAPSAGPSSTICVA